MTSEETKPGAEAAPKEAAPVTRMQKHAERRKADQQTQQALAAITESAKATQLAISMLRTVLKGDLDAKLMKGEKGSVIVVQTPAGADLRDDVGAMLAKVLGHPVVVLPSGITIEFAPDATMAAHGWVRGEAKRSLGLVDAAGTPLQG